jgi:hypothetical protein
LRLAKYFTGAMLILLALWVISGEQITGASSNAIVNARLTTIRSPIAGTTDISFTNIGREFVSNEVIAVIEDLRVNNTVLHNLQREYSDLVTDITSLNETFSINNTDIAYMQSRFDDYLYFAIAKNDLNIASSEDRIRLLDEIKSALVISKEAVMSVSSVQNNLELSRVNENLEIQLEIRRGLLVAIPRAGYSEPLVMTTAEVYSAITT